MPTWIRQARAKSLQLPGKVLKLREMPGSLICRPLWPHWRRGHWHTVLHGEKRQSRRMQWFQPVYVGLS